MTEQTLSLLAPLGLTANARVVVMGMGKTGQSTARFLMRAGIPCAITDSRDQPPDREIFCREYPDIPLFLGGFDASALQAASHILVSPGLPLDTDALKSAAARGVKLLGDLDVFACVAQAPIIAITGANGKSTVTTLLGVMAQQAGKNVRVGGNLGTPMLDLVDNGVDAYILELSSFQLERSTALRAAAATVLNISPDHMDRYPDLAAYAAAKQCVFQGEGVQVLNQDDARVAAMAGDGRLVRWFGLSGDARLDYTVRAHAGADWLFTPQGPLLPVQQLRIQGRHNQSNALAALALGDAMGLDHAAMASALTHFPGLTHRMQWVATIRDVDYINDSKATNIGACEAALSGLNRPVVLIAGGDGKGADFSLLRPVVQQQVRALVLIGRDAPLLASALDNAVAHTCHATTMEDAVRKAQGLAQSGDVVLLAPACASLDQYRDYQARGQCFIDAVRGLKP